MCGIGFYWQPDTLRSECHRIMRQVVTALKHRGPDVQGISSGDGYALGHARLSVIDLVSSSQPMSSPDGRFQLIYNGEVYNYQALRKDLGEHWSFATHGDTEVVLAGLIVQGVEFLSRLQGMWSLALWDTKDKKLLLSRDRMGKKPLYYYSSSTKVVVASELPALKVMLNTEDLSESHDARNFYLKHGFFPPCSTIYNEVSEVEPGGYLLLDCRAFNQTSERFWLLQPECFTGSYDEAKSEFKERFLRSVERRLVADVDVGLLLSGGIDSSLILSSMVNEFGLKPTTFTAGFAGTSYDERGDAEFIAKYFGVENISIDVGDIQPESIVGMLNQNLGQPFGDASILPTAIVSSLAAGHVKVCLSGDGADEAFAGYQRYQAQLMLQAYLTFPVFLRTCIARVISSLPASSKHHSRSLLRKAQLFVNMAEAYELEPGLLAPKLLNVKHEQYFFEGGVGSSLDSGAFGAAAESFKDMMLNDLGLYLPQDILLKADRASMASSLELRSPFLDHELVEFAMSIDPKWHRRQFKGKRLLRDAMQDYLPGHSWRKKKQGFSVPLGDWFKGMLGNQFLELLNSVDISSDVTLGYTLMLQQHRARRTDFGLPLWAAYTYLLWKQGEG